MKQKSALTIFLFLLLMITPGISFAARVSPVDGGRLTSSPGWRLDPFGTGKMMWHNGWDIAVAEGTSVHPTQRGTVYFTGPYKGYGNLVAVIHGKGVVSLYGHLSSIAVKPGDEVTSDTVIAYSGNTGRSTGPHIHYELRNYKEERKKVDEDAIKAAVEQNIESWVSDHENGKGGEFTVNVLPEDIDK